MARNQDLRLRMPWRMDSTQPEVDVILTTKHLDLGCGRVPRNPYGATQVLGVDIRSFEDLPQIRQANLTVERIPFDDHQFDSASAYDFLEHVPRQWPGAQGCEARLPFIELMNEVWRVLRPGGRFYASTPAFPHPDAFVDPTHVNIITPKTHRYFCGNEPTARMYGFRGKFTALRVDLARPAASTVFVPPAGRSRLVQLKRQYEARLGRLSHVIWELEAQAL